jgi:hypothetical protein
MEIQTRRGRRVGKGGGFLKEQDQASALPKVRRGGASENEPAGLGEELIRKGRAMQRQRAWHERTPRRTGQMVFGNQMSSIASAFRSR